MIWIVFGTLIRIYFRIRVENAPKLAGGYVLVANHSSFLDPVLLAAVSRRRVTFLMTVIVFRSALMGWFYRLQRAIPIQARGGNRDALRVARQVLERGEVLGIFPEGGISRDGEPMLGNPGAVSLGLSGDVPIVPLAIIGAFDAFPPGAAFPRPRKVRIVFGDPIAATDLEAGNRRERLSRATRLIMEKITALRAAGVRTG